MDLDLEERAYSWHLCQPWRVSALSFARAILKLCGVVDIIVEKLPWERRDS